MKQVIFNLISSMETATAFFDHQDIIFVDLVYFVKDDQVWRANCEDFTKNKSLDKLGISNGISMGITDVYKNVLVDTDTGEMIDCICSDSYVYGCFLLDEVLKHNPDFEMDTPSIIIRNFTGTVTFSVAEEMVFDEVIPIVNISGVGSVNFKNDFLEL